MRFAALALPLLLLLLAVFGFAVDQLDIEPRKGAVLKLTLMQRVPAIVVLGGWLVEASGLLGLFLLLQGRSAKWWLDGLLTGWIAWIFRAPLLVITLVVAARQPQGPWWRLALAWWVLYSFAGLALAMLARLFEERPLAAAPKVEPEEGLGSVPAMLGATDDTHWSRGD